MVNRFFNVTADTVTTINYIKRNIEASVAVKQAILDDGELMQAIMQVAQVCTEALRDGHKIIFAGNGGSAGDAQHLAAELVGRYEYDRPGLAAVALTTDSSMLTSISNDYGYENVFERQLSAVGRNGDVFIGISTSGNSKNILAAARRAQEMQVVTVGLLGNGGMLDSVCDYSLKVPSADTPRIQESHIMIGHIICGYVERSLFPEQAG